MVVGLALAAGCLLSTGPAPGRIGSAVEPAGQRSLDRAESEPAAIAVTEARGRDAAPASLTSRSPIARSTPYVVAAGRSPIAQPGESIQGPLPARRLAKANKMAVPPPAPAPSGKAVPWHDAHRHLGQTLTVVGRIVTTHRTESVCFLNFSQQWQDKFYVVIFSDALNSWPQPPEQHFRNKKILVAGKIDTHKNRPQIRVTDPRQITIVADER